MTYQRFARTVTLSSCVALAFGLAACTSGSTGDGGSAGVEANVTLTFPPNGPPQKINEACGTIVCTGIDPILGVPRPSADNPEEFCIDLSTTEGADPKNPVGLLAKRGLSAPGDCTIFLKAENETTSCEDEVTFPVRVNEVTELNMTLNCITDPLYGGVDVDGNFNQCPVYRQILVTPTLQSTGNDFTVRTEVYDPDNDSANVIVRSNCGPVDPSRQVRESCEAADGAECDAAITKVTCGEPGDCQIGITVAATLEDEIDGCDGLLPDGSMNPAAQQIIDVTCQGTAECGNGEIDPGESCDPPSDPADAANEDGQWCNAGCQAVDPCNPSDRFCPSVSEGGFNPACASTSCSVSGDPGMPGEMPACDFDFVAFGVSCGSGLVCDGEGQCITEPACTVDADCDDGNECTEDECDDNQCVNEPDEGAMCGTNGECQSDGTCKEPGCTTDNDCDDENECTVNTCEGSGADRVCATDSSATNGDSCSGGAGTCDMGMCVIQPAPAAKILAVDCALLGNNAALPLELAVTPSTVPLPAGSSAVLAPQAAVSIPAELVCGFVGAGFTAAQVTASAITLDVTGATPSTITLDSVLPNDPQDFDFVEGCGDPAGSGPGVFVPFGVPPTEFSVADDASVVSFETTITGLDLNIINVVGPFPIAELPIPEACSLVDRDNDGSTDGPDDSPRIMVDAECLPADAVAGLCAPYDTYVDEADLGDGSVLTRYPTATAPDQVNIPAE